MSSIMRGLRAMPKRSIWDTLKMTSQIVVAAISAGISATALIVSLMAYLLSRQNAVASRRPVLVFEWNEEKGWRVDNPGNGPAVNVRVSVRGKRTGWTPAVTVPAIASGAGFDLAWIGKLNAWMLGAEYEDFNGCQYTTVAQHDRNLAIKGLRLDKFLEHDTDYLPDRNTLRVWNANDLSDDDRLT
jgi:hypothetical protein